MIAVNIHASCVVLAGAAQAFGAPAACGVLLLGPSGAGKSALALRLMARGAALVADDRTELFARDGALWARAPKALAGLIEVRGVGIVRLPQCGEARIALAVDLAADAGVARLPEARTFEAPAELAILPALLPAAISLSATDMAAAEKIVLAAAAFANALFRENGNAH